MVAGKRFALFITEEFDPHTDAVIKKMKGPYARLNTDSYLEKYSLSTRISDTSYIMYSNYNNTPSIDVRNAHSAYFRRPETPRVLSTIPEKTDRAVYRSEIKDYLRQIYECVDDCVWLTHPVLSAQMAGRINQLYLAKSIGFPIPDTLVSSSVNEAKEFFRECRGDVIIKSISSKTAIHGDNHSDIYYTEKIAPDDIECLDSLVDPICPFLLQKKIEKSYELRVTFVGGECFSARIDSKVLDWRRDGEEEITRYQLPEHLRELIGKYMEATTLNMGCLDIVRATNGEYYFLEINPNGQWLWIENATGLHISEAIAKFLDSPYRERTLY